MDSRRSFKLMAVKFLAGFVVLVAGAGGGGALGMVNLGHGSQVPPAAANRIATVGVFTPLESTDLAIEEAVVPAAQAQPRVVVRHVAAPPVALASAGSARDFSNAVSTLNLPALSAASVNCDRLDDSKIQWLLDLVAKTRAANPSSAAVADRVDALLRDGLGKNMCASEAQKRVATMCSDTVVFEFMQKMVKQLPFFIRPLVGDPCKHDLVKAAQKWLH